MVVPESVSASPICSFAVVDIFNFRHRKMQKRLFVERQPFVSSLTIAIGNHGVTKALKDKSVHTGDLKLDYIEVSPITTAMRRMVRSLDFDICEMAFTTYLCAKAFGKRITAIPVFVTRNFHHWAIFYNVNSGITEPKDLEGRTVGVNRGYTVTTGLWARGILQTEYDVDLNKITWAPTDDEHVAEYQAPPNVDYSYCGKSMEDLLLSGKISAAVGDIRVDSPEIQPLIHDAREAGFSYFRKTGVYPLNHGVVIKDSVLDENPGLALNLLNAFQLAKTSYLAGLACGKHLSSADDSTVALSRVVGDPFPFGLSANQKAIETINQFAVDQHIIPKSFTPEDLFASETLQPE